jgi:hypothetical protein
VSQCLSDRGLQRCIVQLTRMIDARSETVKEKPSFRTAAAKHRALIRLFTNESVVGAGLRP